MKCPNVKSTEWKTLVDRFGESIAWSLYDVVGDVPNLRTALSIVKDNGISYSTLSTEKLQSLGVIDSLGNIKVFTNKTSVDNKVEELRNSNRRLRVVAKKLSSKDNSYTIDVAEIKTSQEIFKATPKIKTPTKSSTILNSEDAVKELEKTIVKWLDNVGVSYEKVSEIKDASGNPINALGIADMLQKVIRVVEGKATVETLSEEAAHMFVRMLPKNHPLYQRMANLAVNSATYQSVKDEYSSMYDSEEAFVEETIGKLIAQEISNV